MSVIVSVVVPTYRRPRLLDRCLQALLEQNFPSSAFEIIVVDDGPEDNETRQVVSQWQQRMMERFACFTPPVIQKIPVTGSGEEVQQEVIYQVSSSLANYPRLRYLPAFHTQGPAAARNLGWRSASGEIIAFTDDDTVPDASWLANGTAAFVGHVAGVSGRVVVPLPSSPTDYERNLTGLETSHFVTANCFYRRSALESVGGFDERFQTAWREDSDIFFTLRERGFLLAWSSAALVVHPVRPEPWGSSLRAQRKSFYNALLYKKHPELYQKFIQAGPPWNYYAILGFVLLLAAGLILSSLPLAAAGLAGWLILLGQFVLRRLANTSRAPGHVLEMIVTSVLIPFLSIFWRIRGAIHWRVFFL